MEQIYSIMNTLAYALVPYFQSYSFFFWVVLFGLAILHKQKQFQRSAYVQDNAILWCSSILVVMILFLSSYGFDSRYIAEFFNTNFYEGGSVPTSQYNTILEKLGYYYYWISIKQFFLENEWSVIVIVFMAVLLLKSAWRASRELVCYFSKSDSKKHLLALPLLCCWALLVAVFAPYKTNASEEQLNNEYKRELDLLAKFGLQNSSIAKWRLTRYLSSNAMMPLVDKHAVLISKVINFDEE